METVTLKNGAEAARVLVSTTMLALRALNEQQPVALYELTMACRDKGHVMFGNSGSVAKSLALVESQDADGRARIHDAVRDIVLSAVSGEDFDMVIGSPLAGERK